MEIKQSLKAVLKRMCLSGMLATLPDRLAYAKKTKLSYQDFLELVHQEDEIDQRDQVRLARTTAPRSAGLQNPPPMTKMISCIPPSINP